MKVEGVSEAWLKQYGAKMLEKIDEFCKEKGESVKRDTFPVQLSQTQPQEQLVKVKTVMIMCYLVEDPLNRNQND